MSGCSSSTWIAALFVGVFAFFLCLLSRCANRDDNDKNENGNEQKTTTSTTTTGSRRLSRVNPSSSDTAGGGAGGGVRGGFDEPMAEHATSRRGEPYCIYPRPSYTHSEIYHNITGHRPSITSLYSNYNYNSDSQSVTSGGGGGGSEGGGGSHALPKRTKSGKLAWRGAVAKITARPMHPPVKQTPTKGPMKRTPRITPQMLSRAAHMSRIGGGGWKLPNAYPLTRANSKPQLKTSSTTPSTQSDSTSQSFEKMLS